MGAAMVAVNLIHLRASSRGSLCEIAKLLRVQLPKSFMALPQQAEVLT